MATSTIGDGQTFSRVHPDCINASNPYHECVEYCFRRIAEAQATRVSADASTNVAGTESVAKTSERTSPELDKQDGDAIQEEKTEQQGNVDDAGIDADSYARLTPTQKKLFDLRLKLNAARKANQAEIIAEKKRSEGTVEPRGVSKQKWFEEKKKRLGKQLELNGLDAQKAYMLDTQEQAETKYKKWEKKPAPFGWDVFNQRSLYNAYKKRTKHIPYTMDEYLKAKESDPDFFRDGSSLEYGKSTPIPQENIDKMVTELEDRDRKRKAFSRRRKFHEEKDIDSINDRNEHFNKKIERAFGKYTVEIKNNLERGTALPD